MSPQPARRPLLWLALALALAGLTIATLVTITFFSARSAARRTLAERPTAAPTAIAIAPADPVLQDLAAAADSAPTDPAADAAHAAWVQAMLNDDTLAALALTAASDPEVARLDVATYLVKTDGLIKHMAAPERRGAFLDRHELVGTAPGGRPGHRLGLSRLFFLRGSICFQTSLTAAGEAWLVDGWQPVGADECDALAAHLAAASPAAPPAPTADGAYQTHEAWSIAMLMGEPDTVAALYNAAALDPSAGPELSSKVTRTYAEITRYVVAANAATLGAFLRPEVLGTYAVAADHHVGLTRARFAAGSLCFRSDLAPGPDGWLVMAWEFIEEAECAALAERT